MIKWDAYLIDFFCNVFSNFIAKMNKIIYIYFHHWRKSVFAFAQWGSDMRRFPFLVKASHLQVPLKEAELLVLMQKSKSRNTLNVCITCFMNNIQWYYFDNIHSYFFFISEHAIINSCRFLGVRIKMLFDKYFILYDIVIEYFTETKP